MQRFRPVRSPNTCHWCAGAWSSFPIWGEEMSPEVPSPICSFVPKVGKKQHMEKYVFLAPEAICPILYKRPENYLSTPTIPTNINQHQPTSTNINQHQPINCPDLCHWLDLSQSASLSWGPFRTVLMPLVMSRKLQGMSPESYLGRWWPTFLGVKKWMEKSTKTIVFMTCVMMFSANATGIVVWTVGEG